MKSNSKRAWLQKVLWFTLWATSFQNTEADFTVYWNVPSHQCHSHGIYLNASKFGIVQNTDDQFAGDKVNINYKPGEFPYIENGEPVYGGIPQLADMEGHISTFVSQVEVMPQDYNGLAVLDFEYYLPCYPWAKLEYRQMSDDWVASSYPGWTTEEIQEESERSFNTSTAVLMDVLLQIATELRPNALWGYYHYPYCKNYKGEIECQSSIVTMNDNTLWIYNASTAIYPSIYLYQAEYTEEGRRDMALRRIEEAIRVRESVAKNIPILPYCWYRYHDIDEYLTPEDLFNTIGLSKLTGTEGAVIWGSSSDVSSTEKCTALQDYLENTLGPLVQYIIDMELNALYRALYSKDYTKKIITESLRRTKL